MNKEIDKVLNPVADVLWDGFKESYAWYKMKDSHLQFDGRKKLTFKISLLMYTVQ